MKLSLGFGGILGLVAVLFVGIAAWLFYSNRKKILSSIDPSSQDNLANKGVNSIVQSVTGGATAGGEDSLGGIAARVREYLSGDDAKIKALLQGSNAPTNLPPTTPTPDAGAEAPSPFEISIIPFGA